jgi:antitoxin component YwqK of YwqJK toxin-antitoxin module
MTSMECKAITKEGTQCKRNATIDGYCKQHYEIYNSVESEQYEINNEQALPPELMKYGVSDYIPYDELKELENNIDNLRLNEGRIIKERIKLINGGYKITTKIDGKKRKEEYYNKNNRKTDEYNYNEDEKLDGPLYIWWDNGNKKYEWNCKNGLKEGLQFGWWENGIKKYEKKFKKEEEDSTQLTWWSNGNLKQKRNFKDGILDGIQRNWRENGTLEHEYSFKDPKLV